MSVNDFEEMIAGYNEAVAGMKRIMQAVDSVGDKFNALHAAALQVGGHYDLETARAWARPEAIKVRDELRPMLVHLRDDTAAQFDALSRVIRAANAIEKLID